jgi:methylated-DNA-[protein]-cysteine S-methyltransferase
METTSVYYNSPLGNIRISASGDMITELHFLDEIDSAPADRTAAHILKQCTEQLDQYFKGDLNAFNIPLSNEGTAFQQRVWNALCDIPYGRTISYMELSKRLGDTKAIRAVGTANGKNKIAIIVPCHRVIGSNGNLVGYAGKLWRKQWLLAHEARHGNGVRELF